MFIPSCWFGFLKGHNTGTDIERSRPFSVLFIKYGDHSDKLPTAVCEDSKSIW